MKKILLFGSSGFIGRNIKEYFLKQEGYIVTGPSRMACDLLNYFQTRQVITKLQPDFIINAAYIGVDSGVKYSNEYVFNNLKIVTNILRGSTQVPNLKKMLFFGSGLEYGDSKNPISENHSLNPKNIYATTKAINTLLSLSLANELNLPLVIFRPFNLYGKYDTKSVIYYIISSILENKKFYITKGGQKRDYLFINDLIKIIYNFVEDYSSFENYQIYNIASGKPVQLSTIYKIIFNAMQFNGDSKFREYHKNDYWHQVANISKLKRLIRLDRFTELKEGLQKTIVWIKHSKK